MPRDGNQQYHRPVGTDGVPNTTIESAKYNTYILDVEQDLNLPRPIVTGGTGASNADDALKNLNGEKASQVITDFNTSSWLPGSFYSTASASASPVTNHAFSGIVYLSDPNNIVVEARDRTDTNTPSSLYVREKKGGIWGAWYLASTAPAVQTLIEGLVNNNIAINGNMEVLGDGTAGVAASSVIGVSFSNFYMENWVAAVTTGIPTSVGFVQFTGVDGPPGYAKSYVISATGGTPPTLPANNYVAIYQNIEGWRINKLAWGIGAPSPQSLSIAFWVRAVSHGPYSVLVRNHDATASYASIYTINASNTWEYKTLTIPPPSIGVWKTDNQGALTIVFAMAAGSDMLIPPNSWVSGVAVGAIGQMNGAQNSTDQLKITGVIMLPGTVVPAAADAAKMMRTYDQEAELCKRYFEKSINFADELRFSGDVVLGQTYYANIHFSRTKRAVPTMQLIDGGATTCFPTTSATPFVNAQGFLEGRVASATGHGIFTSAWTANARLS